MRKLLILVAVVLAIGVGWYLGSPRWTMHQMRSAAEAGDARAMAEHVDFPALRADFKRQLKARMMAELAKHGGHHGRGIRQLSEAFSGVLVDRVVDEVVSPAGVQAIMAARTNGGKAPGGIDASRMKITTHGFNSFALRDPAPGATSATLIFTRHGLGWKLSGIDLPEAQEPVPTI